MGNMTDYSKSEIAHKVRITRKKHLGLIAACIAIAVAICGFILWRGGYLFIIDRSISPNEHNSITVYNKALDSSGFSMFSMENATSIIMKYKDDKDRSVRITYGDCTYQGIWWSPDSKKYVIALKYDDGVRLSLVWLERNSESNLSAYLSTGIQMTELSKYGYMKEDSWHQIEYQFLRWALDSESMLIYYSFGDKSSEIHEGYFWYNCMTGDVSAVLELNQ